jgi:hypothetical protein
MESANATYEGLSFLRNEEWVNDLRLPVLKELCIKILGNQNRASSSHGAKALCLEEEGYAVKELTLDDLAWTNFCSYSPVATFYVQGIQPLKNMDPESFTCHVYSDGEIVMFARTWKYDYNDKSRYARPKGSYKNDMTIRAYKVVACEHDDECVGTPYNCYHEYRCKKCGYEHSVDSSD